MIARELGHDSDWACSLHDMSIGTNCSMINPRGFVERGADQSCSKNRRKSVTSTRVLDAQLVKNRKLGA